MYGLAYEDEYIPMKPNNPKLLNMIASIKVTSTIPTAKI